MPTMANVTIKKFDGVTDVVWTAVQASGGDKSPAIWRNLTVGVAPAFMPEARMMSRSNADNTVRRIEGTVDWKQSALGTDGITRKVNVGLVKFEAVVPQGMLLADLNEFTAQSCNFVGSALTKLCLKDGFAPQ